MEFRNERVFCKRSKFGVWQPRYFRGEDAPRRVLYAHRSGGDVGDLDGILLGELSTEIQLLEYNSDSTEKGDRLRLKGLTMRGDVRELHLRDDPDAPGSLSSWCKVLRRANRAALREQGHLPALKAVGWWNNAKAPGVQPEHAYALALAFRLFDADCSQFLDPDETKDLLVAFGRPAASVTGRIAEYDTDRDGLISFDEFIHLFTQHVQDIDAYASDAAEESWKIDWNLESRQTDYNMCAEKYNTEHDLEEDTPGWHARFTNAELEIVKHLMERETSAHALGEDTVRSLLAQPCSAGGVSMCGCAVM